MIKLKIPGRIVVSVLSAGITLSSCNNKPAEIPFPENELDYSQPVSVPLQFTEAKKLSWDTAKKGGVKPVIKHFDLAALPHKTFDSTGFNPFSKAPEVTHFDFRNLPAVKFSLDSLPSKPLSFKTYIQAPAITTKASTPTIQKGNPLSIFDFGIKQGLPALFITSLLKDKNGLLWIGSKEGLFRYDGEHIQAILPGPSSTTVAGMAEDDQGRIWFIDQRRVGVIDMHNGTISYSDKIRTPVNNICKVIKDRKGLIWISKTSSGDVIIIDPVTRTFKSLPVSNGLSLAGGGNDIAEAADGSIWITSPNDGATIVDPAENKIRYFKTSNGLARDTLRAITRDLQDRLWIGIAGGAVEAVDLKQGTIRHYGESQGLRKAFIAEMTCDETGRIWIGKNAGVDVLDPENGTSRSIDDGNGLGAKFVTASTLDNHHRMWVATISGLCFIDQYAETVNPLGNIQVISLMEDTIGNIWVATQEGIKLIDPQKKLLRRFDHSNGLGNDFVQSFTQFNHQIWVTTDGGLDIIDPIKKTIEHTGKNEGLVSDTIYVVLKDGAGNTWLTGPSNGIDLIDPGKQTILHTDVKGGLNDNNIVDAKEDQEGLIWLAGSINGVNVVDSRTGTVKYLNNQPGLRDTCNKMMLVDKYGRIWIGTDKGIYVVDKKLGIITPITIREGLPGIRILSLLEYKGLVLVGMGSKVCIITAPEPAVANGASGDPAKKWKIELLDRSEGLDRETTQSWSTDAVTRKGQYLWGDFGMTIINNIRSAPDSAATFITGMSVMNKPLFFANNASLKDKDSLWTGDTVYVKGQKPVNTGYANIKGLVWNSVAGPYNLPENLSVPYDKNYMQFQFAQTHLSRQDITWYTYALEGIDKVWSTVSTNPYTENYLNLPPGNYTFKVSSKSRGGKWSQPAVFEFTISPPWYKTWWAYTLFTLVALAILRAYIVYRSRRLQRENKVLEEKVTLRTKQLQQSLEDLKATQTQLIQSEKMASLGELTAGIAHEIQNPLNFINNFSEVNTELIHEMNEEIEKGNLREVKSIAEDIAANEQKINHHGRRADGIVKGMLQHSRSGNRQKEPSNINNIADEYLRLAYHGLRAKDKSFNAVMKTDFDPRIKEIDIIPQDIGRVILNLITNAFYAVTEKKKMQGNGYEPTVSVTTRKIGDKAEVRVRDNGNGVPQRVLEKIFQPFFTTKPTGEGTGLGLSLSYDIIKAHHGDLKVETREGEFAEFIVQLPI